MWNIILCTSQTDLWTSQIGLWTSQIGLWTSQIDLWASQIGLWTSRIGLWITQNNIPHHNPTKTSRLWRSPGRFRLQTKESQHPTIYNLWTSQMICGVHKKIWWILMIMNARNITYSKKSDFIPLISHRDPVPHISRSMDFTNDLWTSQSKNQDTLGRNTFESKKSDGKRTILVSSTPKWRKIYEIHKFDLWDSQNF